MQTEKYKETLTKEDIAYLNKERFRYAIPVGIFALLVTAFSIFFIYKAPWFFGVFGGFVWLVVMFIFGMVIHSTWSGYTQNINEGYKWTVKGIVDSKESKKQIETRSRDSFQQGASSRTISKNSLNINGNDYTVNYETYKKAELNKEICFSMTADEVYHFPIK